MTVSDKYGTYLTRKECKFVHAVVSACKDMPLEHGESAIHEAMSSWDMGTHDLFSMMERLEKCEHITDIVSVPTSGLVIESEQEHPLIRKHASLTHEIDSELVSFSETCTHCDSHIDDGDKFYFWEQKDDRGIPKIPNEDGVFCHPSCVEMYYLLTWLKEGETNGSST